MGANACQPGSPRQTPGGIGQGIELGFLAKADLARRILYERTCAACHAMYGQGGSSGPT